MPFLTRFLSHQSLWITAKGCQPLDYCNFTIVYKWTCLLLDFYEYENVNPYGLTDCLDIYCPLSEHLTETYTPHDPLECN